MVLLIRSADIKFDSRINKYITLLERENIEYHVLYWPRNREPEKQENTTFYTRKATYGAKLKSLLGYLGWFKFILSYIRNHRKDITVIHAIDLDTSMVAMLAKMLFKSQYIYEVYDHFADSRNLNGVARTVACKLESLVAKYANDIILVDKKRIKQHGFLSESNIHIIENVPNNQFLKNEDVEVNKPIKICYVGVLESNCRGLENILKAIEGRRIELHIAGFGGCEQLFKETKHNNVFFYGSVDHEKAIELMSSSDVLLGLYYLSNPNHIYASPNKYYEHLFLSKPLITSKGTPPGEKVTLNNSGWVIGDSLNELEELLDWLENDSNRNNILELGENAGECWKKYYLNYFDQFLKPTYLALIKK
ncbi:glycosyltransferase [Pseudoalteromonas mariniglutinosa]